MKIKIIGLTALLCATSTLAFAQTLQPREVDSFVASPAIFATTPEQVKADCDRYLARINADRAALEAETGPATIDGAFRRYDDLVLVVFAAVTQASIVSDTALTAEVRDAARACSQQTSDVLTELSLSRPIYDRLKAIDPASGDAQAQYLLARVLRDAELTGTNRDATTRERLGELQRIGTEASLTFSRNVANGRRVVKATPAELTGLPADFIAAHPPGADGLIEISTDYPDLQPVMSYAADGGLRRRLFETNLSRAWPENDAALATLVQSRYDMAQALGLPDYASFDLATRMVNTPAKAQAFLDGISASAEAPARRDLAAMTARLRRDDPTVEGLPVWSSGYAQQLLKKEEYDVDPQEIRRYFAYDDVRDGIFQLTQDLFSVEIRPWDTPVWSPEVQAFEMYDKGELIGRFYFDNHPRPGKFNHAQIAIIRTGITGRAVPSGVMVANFPAGDHSTGLMEHGQVETFLHEFGHMLHLIFAGKQDWVLQNPFLGLEADFGEAPSTMLENWVWDYDTLKGFARNAQGEVIPEALVARMNRSRGFAEAYNDRRQMGLSAVSLDLYTGAPPADLSQAYLTSYDRYGPSPMAGLDIHPQASFGHLTGYGAAYYTYLWSTAISSDLFTRFETKGLRDRATAQRYRDLVLAPGSSKPANQLVEEFLERPLSLDAYRARLTQ